MKTEVLYSDNDHVDEDEGDKNRKENDVGPCTPIKAIDRVKVSGHLVTQVCTFS